MQKVSFLKGKRTIVHTVKKGETVSDISEQYFGTVEKSSYIRNRNNLLKSDQLQVGEKLTFRIKK